MLEKVRQLLYRRRCQRRLRECETPLGLRSDKTKVEIPEVIHTAEQDAAQASRYPDLVWIDRDNNEISTMAVEMPSRHVDPSLLKRLAGAPTSWVENSGDLFADLMDECHDQILIDASTLHDDEFVMQPLPASVILHDEPGADLDDLIRTAVMSVPIRWRLDVANLLFNLVG